MNKRETKVYNAYIERVRGVSQHTSLRQPVQLTNMAEPATVDARVAQGGAWTYVVPIPAAYYTPGALNLVALRPDDHPGADACLTLLQLFSLYLRDILESRGMRSTDDGLARARVVRVFTLYVPHKDVFDDESATLEDQTLDKIHTVVLIITVTRECVSFARWLTWRTTPGRALPAQQDPPDPAPQQESEPGGSGGRRGPSSAKKRVAACTDQFFNRDNWRARHDPDPLLMRDIPASECISKMITAWEALYGVSLTQGDHVMRAMEAFSGYVDGECTYVYGTSDLAFVPSYLFSLPMLLAHFRGRSREGESRLYDRATLPGVFLGSARAFSCGAGSGGSMRQVLADDDDDGATSGACAGCGETAQYARIYFPPAVRKWTVELPRDMWGGGQLASQLFPWCPRNNATTAVQAQLPAGTPTAPATLGASMDAFVAYSESISRAAGAALREGNSNVAIPVGDEMRDETDRVRTQFLAEFDRLAPLAYAWDAAGVPHARTDAAGVRAREELADVQNMHDRWYAARARAFANTYSEASVSPDVPASLSRAFALLDVISKKYHDGCVPFLTELEPVGDNLSMAEHFLARLLHDLEHTFFTEYLHVEALRAWLCAGTGTKPEFHMPVHLIFYGDPSTGKSYITRVLLPLLLAWGTWLNKQSFTDKSLLAHGGGGHCVAAIFDEAPHLMTESAREDGGHKRVGADSAALGAIEALLSLMTEGRLNTQISSETRELIEREIERLWVFIGGANFGRRMSRAMHSRMLVTEVVQYKHRGPVNARHSRDPSTDERAVRVAIDYQIMSALVAIAYNIEKTCGPRVAMRAAEHLIERACASLHARGMQLPYARFQHRARLLTGEVTLSGALFYVFCARTSPYYDEYRTRPHGTATLHLVHEALRYAIASESDVRVAFTLQSCEITNVVREAIVRALRNLPDVSDRLAALREMQRTENSFIVTHVRPESSHYEVVDAFAEYLQRQISSKMNVSHDAVVRQLMWMTNQQIVTTLEFGHPALMDHNVEMARIADAALTSAPTNDCPDALCDGARVEEERPVDVQRRSWCTHKWFTSEMQRLSEQRVHADTLHYPRVGDPRVFVFDTLVQLLTTLEMLHTPDNAGATWDETTRTEVHAQVVASGRAGAGAPKHHSPSFWSAYDAIAVRNTRADARRVFGDAAADGAYEQQRRRLAAIRAHWISARRAGVRIPPIFYAVGVSRRNRPSFRVEAAESTRQQVRVTMHRSLFPDDTPPVFDEMLDALLHATTPTEHPVFVPRARAMCEEDVRADPELRGSAAVPQPHIMSAMRLDAAGRAPCVEMPKNAVPHAIATRYSGKPATTGPVEIRCSLDTCAAAEHARMRMRVWGAECDISPASVRADINARAAAFLRAKHEAKCVENAANGLPTHAFGDADHIYPYTSLRHDERARRAPDAATAVAAAVGHIDLT